MRVEKDFEHTIRSRLPARDASTRTRKAPPAPPIPAGRFPLLARALPLPSGESCGYCGYPTSGKPTLIEPGGGQSSAQAPAAHTGPSSSPESSPCTSVHSCCSEAEQDPLQTIHGNVHINGTPVLTLFNSGATLSFIDSAIAFRLELNTTRIHAPLVAASPMGKFIETDKMYRACPITLTNHEVTVDLIVMPVRHFDIILGMGWLTSVRVVMDCRDKTVTISVLGQASFTLKGRGRCQEFESLQALDEAETVEATIGRILVLVRDFSEVFQEILGLPPRRVVDFCIVFKLRTAPISLPLSRMPSCEMKELRC
ncbi:uncharacterized protein LOC131250665 [Magnolia sinica]|uniref:uncharacterized protein LOC131250665 n=1 Tax=Magnolia sinica TaxID=86752 RepID=UPI0026599C97|nr:uncharacterized protein LOC131250665 [Magnolia sinica]